jgi:DMSO/TMAO reductase YedYZ molybdopterin-dependent catalytic subunit
MPDRREFLGALAAAAPFSVAANAGSTPPVGMIPRETNPPNLETHPLDLRDEITRTDVFYVRNHFPTPKIDAGSWRLRVEGSVQRPCTLTMDDIKKGPGVTRRLTMECAGNGRVFLTPKVRGVNWAQGAVGNAEWKGIPLAAVLDLVQPKADAVDVVLEGADVGQVIDEPRSPGPIAYARSLPITKARQAEVLLAYEMNGQPLTPDHGWPLRAVVGGWYGMASVKWLTRIIVTSQPFQGFWQTMDYSEFARVNGVPTMQPITAMRVKSIVLTPIGTHRPSTIDGVAWAGEHAVAKVEVSTDGGQTWKLATLVRKAEPFQWVHWKIDHLDYGPGVPTVMARATDTAGNTQPMQRDGDRRTYQINHVIPVSGAH